jgi:hypothetical protein
VRSSEPTPTQLAHNDQVLADINRRIDALIEVHRLANKDGDLHPQVQLAGFAEYLERHSDTVSLAQFLAIAIDRLLKAARQNSSCPSCESVTRDGPILGRRAIDKGDGPEWCDDEWHDQDDADTRPQPSGGAS